MFELYNYGDTGLVDNNNPYYYFSEEAKEVLLNIARYNKPIIKQDDLIENLIRLEMISKVEDNYYLKFPFFLKEDVNIINEYAKTSAKKLFKIIHSHYDDICHIVENDGIEGKEILYHFLGCDILDGTAIDYFNQLGYLSIGKPQVGNRDYLLIGFEEETSVLNLSQNLLCSCNLYHHPDIRFKSFGDAAGDRNDVYRLLRQVNVTISKIKSKSSDIYNKLNQQYNNDMISRAGKVVESLLNETPHDDIDTYKLLESLDYVENNKVIVPVFDKQHKEMFSNLSSYVLELISIEAKQCFDDIESLNLMAVKHQINRYEIANELWHQIFGTLNEMLVEYSLIKVPSYHKDEGRYLKAIYTKEYYD